MRISPREELLKFALGYMVSKNHSVERYIKYAKLIRSQVELIQNIENRPIAVSDWIQMAIELGRQALVKKLERSELQKAYIPLWMDQGN